MRFQKSYFWTAHARALVFFFWCQLMFKWQLLWYSLGYHPSTQHRRSQGGKGARLPPIEMPQRWNVTKKTCFSQGCRNPGGWGIYPPNNLTLACIWAQVSTWIRGKQVFHLWWRPFLLVFTWIRGKKCSIFGEDLFFVALHLICSPEKNRGRGPPPQCWK